MKERKQNATVAAAVICHALNELGDERRNRLLEEVPQKIGHMLYSLVYGLIGAFYNHHTIDSLNELRRAEKLQLVNPKEQSFAGLTTIERELIAQILWDHLRDQLENIKRGTKLDLPNIDKAT